MAVFKTACPRVGKEFSLFANFVAVEESGGALP